MSLLQYETEDKNALQNYEHLHPETLHSYQLTFSGTQWLKGLDFELNAFYNRAEELIFSHILGYGNGGMDKTIGVEMMAGYKKGRLTANLNATWIRTLKSSVKISELFHYDINHNNSIPSIMANLVTGWQATKNLRVFAKASFQGEQSTYNVSVTTLSQIYGIAELLITDAVDDEQYRQELTKLMIDLLDNKLVSSQDINPRIVFDLGAEYRLGKLSFGLNIHNLFNKKYNQSGMDTGLVPQRGLWFLASVGYEF